MELKKQIDRLASHDSAERKAAAEEIFRAGQRLAEKATGGWLNDGEFISLLGPPPKMTVGVAVGPAAFEQIRKANGSPRLAEVPPDQDAQEFELHFEGGVSLDVLTSKMAGGKGAIARYLARFGEGIQQVEFLCRNVDRATQILREKFGIAPIYAETRPGADGTRVNFFLVATPEHERVLIELYEKSGA
jgi:hypothetical protein